MLTQTPSFSTLILLAFFFISNSFGSVAHAGFVDMEGNPKKLEDFMGNGKWLLVKIWKSDCGICVQTAEGIINLNRQYSDRLRVIGISIDGPSGKRQAEKFLQRSGIDYPTLLIEYPEFELYFLSIAQEEFRGTPTYLLYSPQQKLMGVNPGIMDPDAVIRFIKRNSPGSSTENVDSNDRPEAAYPALPPSDGVEVGEVAEIIVRTVTEDGKVLDEQKIDPKTQVDSR